MGIGSRLMGCSAVLMIALSVPSWADSGETTTVQLKPGKASRAGHISVSFDSKGNPKITPAKDAALPHQGDIKVDGETFRVYLPAATPYSIKNTGTGEGQFENRSTLISIDANRDGNLTDDEGWYADLPIRIGDRMFEVVRIAPDGSSITVKRSAKPLAGMIVGRKVPPFTYKTSEGKTITQDTYRGKALLIDIWSST